MIFRNGIIAAIAVLFCVSCSHKQKAKDTASAQQTEMNSKDQQIGHSDQNSYFCVVNKDKRVIKMDKSQKRCEVHYTKFGEKSQVAWAENTPSICSDVYDRIRTNIESKGFKCQAMNENQKQSKEHKSASIN